MTANDMKDEEETLVALIVHRTKVEHLQMCFAYHKSKLDESEKNLEETQSKLARVRSRGRVLAIAAEEDCQIINTKKKPLLVIPKVCPLTKRKIDEDLVEMVCSRSSSCNINYETSNHISSPHTRKLRSLVLCP